MQGANLVNNTRFMNPGGVDISGGVSNPPVPPTISLEEKARLYGCIEQLTNPENREESLQELR